HIALTLVAVGIGFVISMTLALAAHRYRLLEQPTILVSTFLYTIPSLALFELLVAPVGANVYSAEIALVSYTLLILFRNILAGMREVPTEVLDAADGMGMTRAQLLLRVELPLALPAIVAGLRIAVVTTIALATIVYTIYNAGLGVPIHAALGEGPFKTELIAAGGLTILLALVADGLIVLAVGDACLGLGLTVVELALVILAVPPVITNTYLAVDSVDHEVVDAARGMGMSGVRVLARVELPLAVPLIFAGIRTASVFVLSTTTIASLAGFSGSRGDIIANETRYHFSGELGG